MRDTNERTKVETLACRLCHCGVLFVYAYVSSRDCPLLRLTAANRKLPDVCWLWKRNHDVPPYRNGHVLTPDTHVTGLLRTCVLEQVVLAIWIKKKKKTKEHQALYLISSGGWRVCMCSLCQSHRFSAFFCS